LTQQFWKGCKDLIGRVPTSMRIYARLPKVAMWMLPFITALQREGAGGKLDGRTKELAVLKTSLVNACDYCMGHNVVLAQATGISIEQIDALGDGYEDSELLGDREKAVVRWAEAVTRNTAYRDDAAFEALRKWFDDDEILELTWVSALFNMLNRMHDTLHLDLEAGSEIDKIKATAVVPQERVFNYVRRMVDYLGATEGQLGSGEIR
jgi:uncharacterized peroxidase-related enzyme